jgi:hypothetical protein
LVKNTLKKMDIPSKDDVKKLEDRIKKLEGVKKTPVKPKPAPKVVKKPAAKK